MRNGRALLVAVLLIPLIFSSTGCSGIMRKSFDEAKDYFQTQVLPGLQEKGKEVAANLANEAKESAIAYIDAKLVEEEQKVLAKLDATLLAVADIDAETGSPTNVKRWEDFDENGDGFLQPKEHGKASWYAAKKAAASGDWGLAAKIGTGGAGGMAILAAAEFARRRKRKIQINEPPDGPAPEAPPTAGAV